VRRAAADDVAAIQTILQEARRWLAARGIAQWTRPFGTDWIAAKIDAGEFFIARVEDAPVGVVRLLWENRLFWGDRDRGDAGYLHTLAVRTNRAGQGLGADIVRWAEYEVRGRGRRALRLDCAAENRALGAYYERLGFVVAGTASVGGETMMLFEKMLTTEGQA
jgi:GNAT superfamily N-acetyltransferase